MNNPDYIEDIRTGHATDEFLKNLKNSISNYVTKHNGYYYIGISNNPMERNKKHAQYGKGHKQMIVLYKTSSSAVCKNVERELVSYYQNNEKYSDLIWNGTGGGGGKDGESGPYYLYLLLWE